MKKLITSITTLFLCILIAGCAKVPKVEIETATAAISEAKSVEAMRYAPKEFKASEETFANALSEIEIQDKKLWGKDYKQASSLLKEVVVTAREAVKKTEELKARTVEEATKADAETAINRVYAAYKERTKSGKNVKQLEEIMDLLKQAQSAMKDGNYKGAVDAAQRADAKMTAL